MNNSSGWQQCSSDSSLQCPPRHICCRVGYYSRAPDPNQEYCCCVVHFGMTGPECDRPTTLTFLATVALIFTLLVAMVALLRLSRLLPRLQEARIRLTSSLGSVMVWGIASQLTSSFDTCASLACVLRLDPTCRIRLQTSTFVLGLSFVTANLCTVSMAFVWLDAARMSYNAKYTTFRRLLRVLFVVPFITYGYFISIRDGSTASAVVLIVSLLTLIAHVMASKELSSAVKLRRVKKPDFIVHVVENCKVTTRKLVFLGVFLIVSLFAQVLAWRYVTDHSQSLKFLFLGIWVIRSIVSIETLLFVTASSHIIAFVKSLRPSPNELPPEKQKDPTLTQDNPTPRFAGARVHAADDHCWQTS